MSKLAEEKDNQIKEYEADKSRFLMDLQRSQAEIAAKVKEEYESILKAQEQELTASQEKLENLTKIGNNVTKLTELEKLLADVQHERNEANDKVKSVERERDEALSKAKSAVDDLNAENEKVKIKQ